MKNCFIFPGQGAQYFGMGRDFYENFSEAKAVFDQADEILGQNFKKILFEDESAQIHLTKHAQPALYIHSYAILSVIKKNFPHLRYALTMGLSLGEYTALTAAEKLPFEEGLRLVSKRGEFMQVASEKRKGTMAALLPAEEDIVAEVLKPYQRQNIPIYIANLNANGQVVIAGTPEAIEQVSADLKAKGVKRIIFLDVSGAFHTPLMHSAQESLKPYIDSTRFQESEIDVIMNVTGKKVETIAELKKNLYQQIVSIVYWQKSVQSALDEKVDCFIEIGAGKTLTNINKKTHTKQAISIEKIQDLDLLADF